MEAGDAERGPDYICPNCRMAVILKKGQIKTHHFAHKPPTACTWASGETQAHLQGKKLLRDGFAARGLVAEVEVPVLSSGGDRRADVLVSSPDGRKVAVELQHQPLSFEQIEARTKAYMRAGVPVVWIGLLNEDLWDAAEPTGSSWRIKRFSVRPWQRWAHAYGMGALWFLDVPTGMLWKGKLTDSVIYVEVSTWYDSYGNEESAGGYDRVSKRWKTLTLQGPYPPEKVLFEVKRRKEWTGKAFSIPAGRMARLTEPM